MTLASTPSHWSLAAYTQTHQHAGAHMGNVRVVPSALATLVRWTSDILF
jgi:hypothetical protein